jgi:alanine-synthesizing transaminase
MPAFRFNGELYRAVSPGYKKRSVSASMDRLTGPQLLVETGEGMNSDDTAIRAERDFEWMRDDPLTDLNRAKLELVSAGRPLIDLSMINPDLAPPRFLLDKLLEATVKPANHRYAVSRGVRRLRESFALKYRAAFGVPRDPEREICVTLGTKDALVSVLRVLGSVGDVVALAEPTYPAHLSAVHLAGLQPCSFPLGDSGAALVANLERALQSQRCVAVLINLPNNPTGLVASADEMAAICRVARKHGAVVINDFVYGEMVFGGGSAPSILGCADGAEHAVEIYSLSKAYSVPGWRVGALLGPEAIVRQVARLKSHTDYGIFLPLQIAAAAALSAGADLTAVPTQQYAQRSQLLVAGLRRLGWETEPPRAGASVWARLPVEVRGRGAFWAVERMLRRAELFALPGGLFGQRWGEYVRFAVVVSEERLREGVARLEGDIWRE